MRADGHRSAVIKAAHLIGNQHEEKNNFPGVGIRSLAFLIDFLMNAFLFLILCSTPRIAHLATLYLSWWEKYFGKSMGVNILGLFVLLYFSTQVFRFVMSLIFSKTWGQMVAGIQNAGNLFEQRLNGGAKIVIDSLASPFFLFTHFGLIRGQSTFAEKLLMAPQTLQIKIKQSRIRVIGVASLLSILAFPAPLLLNFFSDHQIYRSNNKESQTSLPILNSAAKSYISERFGFSTLSNLENNRFVILPYFEFIQLPSRVLVIPWPQIYDSFYKNSGGFKALKKIDIWGMVEKTYFYNPLFKWTYPKLYEQMALGEKRPAPQLENELIYQELEELVFQSLNLDWREYWSQLWIKGPFILDKMLFKKMLDKKLPLDEVTSMKLTSLGSGRFLNLNYQLDDYRLQAWHAYALGGSNDALKEVNFRSFYLSLNYKNPIMLEFVWDADNNSGGGGELIPERFIKNFFASAQWGGILDQSLLNNADKFTPFTIMDYLTKTKISSDQKEKIYKYTIDYYTSLGRNLWKNPDPELQKSLSRIIDNNIQVVNQLIQYEKDTSFKQTISAFELKLKNIQTILTKDRLELLLEDSISAEEAL